jgi:hypothetical protein
MVSLEDLRDTIEGDSFLSRDWSIGVKGRRRRRTRDDDDETTARRGVGGTRRVGGMARARHSNGEPNDRCVV